MSQSESKLTGRMCVWWKVVEHVIRPRVSQDETGEGAAKETGERLPDGRNGLEVFQDRKLVWCGYPVTMVRNHSHRLAGFDEYEGLELGCAANLGLTDGIRECWKNGNRDSVNILGEDFRHQIVLILRGTGGRQGQTLVL